MASPLERLNVLVVDDSHISRALLASLLRSLGIRHVFQASDGLAAVEFLKLVADNPNKAGASQIDIVLTDLVMPRCDGPTLIRWIRLAPQSPDRFVPVVAISGAPALERVTLARDVGANDVLGKPFSAQALGERLVHLVNHPRQFVLAPGYFGPERRRSGRPFVAERRVMDPDAVQVIHAGDGTRELPATKRVIYFRLRNRLLDKVGLGEMPDFDPALLRQAQDRIREMAGDYVDWMRSSIALLRYSVEELLDGRGERAEHLQQIKSIALEFGSQGSMFDYPLMTRFGYSLYAATREPPLERIDGGYFMLLKAHVDGIGAVVSQRISGDGGQIGREVLAALDAARRKYRVAAA